MASWVTTNLSPTERREENYFSAVHVDISRTVSFPTKYFKIFLFLHYRNIQLCNIIAQYCYNELWVSPEHPNTKVFIFLCLYTPAIGTQHSDSADMHIFSSLRKKVVSGSKLSFALFICSWSTLSIYTYVPLQEKLYYLHNLIVAYLYPHFAAKANLPVGPIIKIDEG